MVAKTHVLVWLAATLLEAPQNCPPPVPVQLMFAELLFVRMAAEAVGISAKRARRIKIVAEIFRKMAIEKSEALRDGLRVFFMDQECCDEKVAVFKIMNLSHDMTLATKKPIFSAWLQSCNIRCALQKKGGEQS